METAALVLFIIYAAIIAFGALAAALAANLVRALLGLILALFGVAGMYLLMNAPFVAVMQLLIYVGAVVVLIFFAIMLTKAPAGAEESKPRPIRKYFTALVAASAPVFVLGWVLLTFPEQGSELPAEVAVSELGKGLMEPYIVAFELISVVLFVAMSGAVLLGFKKRNGK
ncbi:NADH-quinone oxidoreductase subunit J family protein [Desulfohalovibrio reitneri]|uniref:NADH-quinone oxidoreductase subunit J family protein n=1 Tax=Desulfohalovibrio reitneri TaxID=1307759 RepID=UPI0004A71871|nr:NADH-quinone oxidoreductase subunit J [Desulfohalovibrio reitneri]